MTASHSPRLLAIVKHAIWIAIALLLFLGALWVLHRELSGVRFNEVLARFRELPWYAVLLAVGFTAASYAALAGYDWLALRHIGRRLPFVDVALTSFTATAVGHNLGVAMLSGGAVRYRLYSAAGLSAAEIATVIGLIGLTFGLGVSFVGALTLLLATPETTQVLHVSERRVADRAAVRLFDLGRPAQGTATDRRLAVSGAPAQHNRAASPVRPARRGLRGGRVVCVVAG